MIQSASTAIHGGQWIDIKAGDGGSFGGYLAVPAKGHGPGILLIQEIFGVNGHIRGVAEQYATAGFVVLAPDLFWRLQPRVEIGYDEAGFQQGFGLLQKLDRPKALADLGSALKALRARPEIKGGVASVGYCAGGTFSFAVAANTDIDAAVCYYPGAIDQQLGQAATVKAPLLFHFAGRDHFIPDAAVQKVEAAFPGDKAQVERYPDVDHGFNCWDRAAYNQKAASLAFGRTLGFLSQHIG